MGAFCKFHKKTSSLWVTFENFMRKMHLMAFGYLLKFFFIIEKNAEHNIKKRGAKAGQFGSYSANSIFDNYRKTSAMLLLQKLKANAATRINLEYDFCLFS